jgi:hypothetical protein
MKKLRFNPEDLKVESFEISSPKGKGTVKGNSLVYTDTTCDSVETCMWCITYNQYECHTSTQHEVDGCFSAPTNCYTGCPGYYPC